MLYIIAGLPLSGKKSLENKKNSRSGKSQGISFSVRGIYKNYKKGHGKVREFRKEIQNKLIVNTLVNLRWHYGSQDLKQCLCMLVKSKDSKHSQRNMFSA